MVITYNDRIKGIPKKDQYKTIRQIRESYLDSQIKSLINSGGISLKEYPSYIIMSNGDVYSTLNTKLTKLKPGTKPGGYLFVGLTNSDGERKYEMVHRLVAKAFIKKQHGKEHVNHIDGNKKNNSTYNLEWCSPSENSRHALDAGLAHSGLKSYKSKLNKRQLEEIYYAKGKYRDIGRHYGVCAQTVCNIKNKNTYKKELQGVV